MSAPTVSLPPAGPALTLHQAADKLRRAATKALAEVFWPEDRPAGMTGGLGGAGGDLAALLSPPLALDMADWLDAIACAAVRHAAGGYGNEQAEVTDGWPMSVARRILEAS